MYSWNDYKKLIFISMIREYSWQDWISNPQNKQLYNKDMKEGLRQFQLEKQRRNNLVKVAAFNIGLSR